MFKCQNIARDRRSELIKVVCAACAGSHEVESSKCGQRSTLLLVAGRRRVEVLPPFLFFFGGGSRSSDKPKMHSSSIVPVR